MQQLNKFKLSSIKRDNFFCNMIVKSPLLLVNYSLNYYCYEKKENIQARSTVEVAEKLKIKRKIR